MPRFPSFIGGSHTAQSVIADAEETINLYVEQIDSPGATSPSALLPTPGFSIWAQAADVGDRASLAAEGRLFKVIGATFYEFDVNGTPTIRGAVAVDGNPAQIIFNGVVGGQLGIAAGGNAYAYDLATNVLTLVLAGECTMIGYAAGFGLAFNLTTGKVRLSRLNDLTTWDAGTFWQRSLAADPYQAMFVDPNNLVWMIGTDSFEVRYNSGTGTQPFIPLPGLVGRWGIVAPFAFSVNGSGNFWLARNPEGVGQFVATRGGAPSAISTGAFANAVEGYLRTSRIDDAEVLSYQQAGRTFVAIQFPSVPATWVVDADQQTWHRRGRWNSALGRYEVWAPRSHAFAFGKHLVGDRTSGTVWAMDLAVATDIDGQGIRRLRRSPHLTQEHRRVPIDQFELLLDVGLGVPSGQGSDPQALLRVSHDGGRTYGNERRSGVGRIGEYRRRCYWTRLGAPADAVFEVVYSEPTPFRIVDAWVNNLEAA